MGHTLHFTKYKFKNLTITYLIECGIIPSNESLITLSCTIYIYIYFLLSTHDVQVAYSYISFSRLQDPQSSWRRLRGI